MERIRRSLAGSISVGIVAPVSEKSPSFSLPLDSMWAVVRIQAVARRWLACTMQRILLHSLSAQRQLAAELLASEQRFVASLDCVETYFVAPLRAAMPSDEHAKLFELLPALQNSHRVLLRQLEIRVEPGRVHCGLLALLRRQAAAFGLLVEYAQGWASAGAFALWKLERQTEAGPLLLQLQAAAATGPGGLRELLEAPLSRLDAFERVATELGCAIFARHDTGEMSTLLLELDRRGVQLSAALAPLGRLRPLWGVLGRFKPGEVEELLEVPGRTLRHHGSLLKKTAVGKVSRHYFLFSDAILTAEATKGA
jgi:hypothetical protein